MEGRDESAVRMNDVLDMTVVDELLSLSDDGDPELLLDLIRLFLEDGPAKVAAVRTGLDSRDYEMMERAAHSLKGSSGNLGARRLQMVCEQLQIASRTKDESSVVALTPQLQVEFDMVRTALNGLQHRFG